MITRLSKIARLPADIREQLNRRLHDGELSRTILPWVNSLRKTRKVLAELFNNKPITHQNLSEWRRADYQDWLFHQQRLDWFTHFSEQSTEIEQHDGCPDTFETMANIFLFEIAQGLNTMKTIKDPHERREQLQNLTREFARLQNAYNWSRRVELDFAKHNATLEVSSPVAPPLGPPASRRHGLIDPHPSDAPENRTTQPSVGGASPSARTVLASPVPVGDDVRSLKHPNVPSPSTLNEERQRAGALPDAPRTSEPQEERASVPDCGSPLPLSAPNSLTLKLPNSQTPPRCQPIPPLAPTPTPQVRNLKGVHVPMRGRRFICIEG
jgi:hypothetical protein